MNLIFQLTGGIKLLEFGHKLINSKKIIKKERQKIASIGIRVRKKISFHGISVNINPNLDFFDKIILCGLENTKATSAKELGVKISYNAVSYTHLTLPTIYSV